MSALLTTSNKCQLNNWHTVSLNSNVFGVECEKMPSFSFLLLSNILDLATFKLNVTVMSALPYLSVMVSRNLKYVVSLVINITLYIWMVWCKMKKCDSKIWSQNLVFLCMYLWCQRYHKRQLSFWLSVMYKWKCF